MPLMPVSSALRPLLAALGVAGLLLTGVAGAQPAGDGRAPAARPDPRLEQLQRMAPAERREAWRRMSPDERSAVRNQIPPERRDEMRQRWLDSRERGPGEGAHPDSGPRRLSPEERQRLRDQINETNRDLRWKGARRQEFQRRGGNR